MNVRVRAAVTAVAVVVTAVLVLAGCSDSNHGSGYHFSGFSKLGSIIPSSDRQPAENATGTLLDGGKFDLAASKGKIVLLNFWATWCPPCVVETPQLDLVYRAYRSKGVEFFGIDTKNYPAGEAKSFVADNKITYPMVYDEEGSVAVQLGSIPTSGLPFSVLLDRQGRVAAVYNGPVTPKDLEPVLDRLRAEST
jgi:thiol-disulfide isomerase/thioredoxin